MCAWLKFSAPQKRTQRTRNVRGPSDSIGVRIVYDDSDFLPAKVAEIMTSVLSKHAQKESFFEETDFGKPTESWCKYTKLRNMLEQHDIFQFISSSRRIQGDCTGYEQPSKPFLSFKRDMHPDFVSYQQVAISHERANVRAMPWSDMAMDNFLWAKGTSAGKRSAVGNEPESKRYKIN